MKQHLWKLLPLLLLPLLLTGCWQDEPPLSEENDLLQPIEELLETPGSKVILPDIFSLPYAPDQTLDPISCADGMQQVLSSLICEGLFRLNANLEPIPTLCQSYTYDAATLTYVFTLRSGITFSDGSPLTAADVKATLDRARKSQRYASRLSGISKLSTDAQAVIVTLSAPNSAFPALLDVPIVKNGTDFIPVGTGPYAFSKTDSDAFLVANKSWWQGSVCHPTDRIRLIEASNQDSLLYRFTSHDVQLITADLTGTNPITATGSISYQDVNTTILQYLGCNTRRAPFDNQAFRSALWKGINREHLVSAFLSGHGIASQFPISPVAEIYPEALEESYNSNVFRTAVQESGYTSSRKLSLLVNAENSFKISVARQIAADFTAGGVPTEVQVLPWSDYIAALASGKFDLYYGEVKLSADWNLSSLLGTGGSLNYGGWANPQTDQLLASLSASAQREVTAKQLCSHLKSQAPILPICFKSTSVLMQSDVLPDLESTVAEPFYNLKDCTIRLQNS